MKVFLLTTLLTTLLTILSASALSPAAWAQEGQGAAAAQVDTVPTHATSAPLDEPPALAPPGSEDEIDRLTSEISAVLRCPVCQGLSVNDSPADGARSMKARVRGLVAQGYTGDQINDYFVGRYGTWILLAPPAQGTNWAVYIGPFAFLALGGVLVAWTLKQRPLTQTDAESQPASSALATGHMVAGAVAGAGVGDDLDPYRRRILSELGLQEPGEMA